MKAAQEFVARRALAARPKIAVMHDALRVHWHDDVVMAKSDVLNLLCFFLPDQVLAALQGMIGEQSPSNAMPASERIKRVAELEARLLELERSEEAMIVAAAAAGQDILRRVDADPRALLNVVVRARAQATAA